jgi:histone H2A
MAKSKAKKSTAVVIKSTKSPDGTKNPSKTKSAKAGLVFPVSRVNRHLRDAKNMKRVGAGAPVYLAAILEYIAAEVLEISGNATAKDNRKRITHQDVMRCIRNDPELHRATLGAVLSTENCIKGVTKAVTIPKELADKIKNGKADPTTK